VAVVVAHVIIQAEQVTAVRVLLSSDINRYKIFTEHNFIPTYACDWLIDFHKKYFKDLGHVDDHNRHVLDLNHAIHVLRFDNEFNDSDPLKYLQSKFQNYISNIDKDSFINYSRIVYWPKDSYQPTHLDFSYHAWTSVLYLNDVNLGGELVVEDQTIKPKKSMLVTFQGNAQTHSVNLVQENRYTISTWYKKFNQ